MAKSKVDWFGEDVMLKVVSATRQAIEATAIRVVGQTEINITANNQVDTGFMRNSVYFATKDDSTYEDADTDGAYVNLQGDLVERSLAPEAPLPAEYDALVCIGADYAIFQEMANSFLYPALQQVRGEVKGILQRTAKEAGL
ncbi:MAG: hypothetical protein H6662_15615 [Ardenticatenaceae bacterium]|nr:hypothetical protein [Anaerolineales bacterium]MCB8923015.1 hypothetical protein [Ardenticatenaceae bacterium]